MKVNRDQFSAAALLLASTTGCEKLSDKLGMKQSIAGKDPSSQTAQGDGTPGAAGTDRSLSSEVAGREGPVALNGNGAAGGLKTAAGGPAKESFGPSNENFGPARENFGPARENFGPARENFGPARENFGPARENFGPARENFGPARENIKPMPIPTPTAPPAPPKPVPPKK